MLLLVVGLVVIVLVILVVVFLSVRSMRADEGEDYPPRRSEPRRQPAGARPAGGRTTARTRTDDRRGDRRGLQDDAAQRRFGSLPRPRGHQHDEEFDARDWGGVSDEQYWAELSADKPLATTARSAQPGSDPRPVQPARGADDAATATAPTDRQARRDSAAPSPAREPAPTMAVAGAPTTQFSLRSGSEGRGGRRSAAPGHWTDPAAGGPQTDPTIGRPGSWQEPAADSSPTAAWAAPGTDMRGTDLRGTDLRGTDLPGTGGAGNWGGADPLTSASFPVPGAHSADTASYLDAHGSGYEHTGVPSWDSPGRHGAAEQYDGGADSWRGSEHEYLAGLEPAGSAAGWYPAPTAEQAYSPAEPPAGAWDHDQTGYAARDDLSAGHGSEPSRYDWDQAGHRERDQASVEYQAGHYADGTGEPSGYGSAGNGYELPDHVGRGSEPSGYHPADTGYQLPDYRPAGYHGDGGGYPPGDNGSADNGYQLGYDRATSGYEVPDTAPYQAGYGPAATGYDLPEHTPADPGYGLPDHGGYQLPGHGTAGAGYLPDGQEPADYRVGYDPAGGYRLPGHGTDNGYSSR